MDELLFRLLALVIGYGFGCLQFAFIITKIVDKTDIRESGSGNAGMTNVTRKLGFKWGGLVFVLDMAKAIAAFSIVNIAFEGGGGFFAGTAVLGLYAGLGAILGHNFPFFMKFKGGKGVSCMAGVILIFDWRIALTFFVIFVIVLVITRYISVVSLAIAVLFPIMLFCLRVFVDGIAPLIVSEPAAVAVIIGALCWYKHRGNIKRLLSGTESKFNFKKERSDA